MKSFSEKALNITPSMTLSISAKAKEMKESGRSVISFSVGEPDFKTPEYIVDAAKSALDNGFTKYTPVGGIAELKKAVCNKFLRDNGLEYDISDIVVSTGAKSSLYHTMRALLNPGDEVIIPTPYWLTYPEIVLLCGGVPVFAKTKAENGYKITASELDDLITDKTKCLILNSPNNPSGSVYSESELKKIAEVAVKRDLFVISDEVYEKLVFEGKHVSIASLGEDIKKNTIVVNAVSKTYAMTGWRIGYLACDKSIAKLITAIQSHSTSNATSFAQYGALAALEGGDASVKEMVKEFAERRALAILLLDGMTDVSYVTPHGAFYIFADVSEYFGKTYKGKIIDGSLSFADALLDECGVAVVPGKPFGDDGKIRISYATNKDNIAEGLTRMKTFLNFLKK